MEIAEMTETSTRLTFCPHVELEVIEKYESTTDPESKPYMAITCRPCYGHVVPERT